MQQEQQQQQSQPPALDLEGSPVPGQMGSVVLDALTGEIVASSSTNVSGGSRRSGDGSAAASSGDNKNGGGGGGGIGAHDASILYQMLVEAGTIRNPVIGGATAAPDTGTGTGNSSCNGNTREDVFRRMTVTVSSTRYVMTTDGKHVYVVATRAT